MRKSINMNFKPILFSTDMVRAILEGRKMQTRRMVKPEPIPGKEWDGGYYLLHSDKSKTSILYAHVWGGCRYGAVGDVLWVKETFWQYGRWTPSKNRKYKKGLKWRPLESEPIQFVADNTELAAAKGIEWSMGYEWRKMSSLFLEAKFARIFLEVTNIRVQRLQEISERDAICEGVELIFPGNTMGYRSYAVADGGAGVFPYVSFKTLWQKINGPDSWSANPFVWAISFKRIERPDNFLTNKPKP